MMGIHQITIYSNIVAIMLVLGVIVLALRFRIKDELEKKIFISVPVVLIVMSVLYIVTAYRDAEVLKVSAMGATLIETGLEYAINLFAIQWFMYVLFCGICSQCQSREVFVSLPSFFYV